MLAYVSIIRNMIQNTVVILHEQCDVFLDRVRQYSTNCDKQNIAHQKCYGQCKKLIGNKLTFLI